MEERRRSGTPVPAGPCAQARNDAESACADAQRLRTAADEAAAELVRARRGLDQAEHEADEAAASADRRRRTDAKLAAREAYRARVARATDAADRQAATATWLAEINRINREAHAAARLLDVARGRVMALRRAAEAAARDADAQRIRSEAAAHTCMEARHRAAVCEEQLADAEAGSRSGTHGAVVDDAAAGQAAAGSDPEHERRRRADARSPIRSRSRSGGATALAEHVGSASPIAAAGPDRISPHDDTARHDDAAGREGIARQGGAGPGSAAGEARPLLAELVFDGDRPALLALARRLADVTGRATSHYVLLLQELVDEVAAAAGRGGHFTFDRAHPLWAQLEVEECRLIMRALSDLGFRIDGHDGWVGGRAPANSDLAMAVAYAGYDTRILRKAPLASQSPADLARSVRLAAVECLTSVAPDLTVVQLVGLLGPAADGLGELWDEWSQVRPRLLGPSEAVAV